MTYITETSVSFFDTITSVAATVANAVNTFVSDIYRAGTRAAAIEELQALDDATLKTKHGIARSQIVAYVFQDKILP